MKQVFDKEIMTCKTRHGMVEFILSESATGKCHYYQNAPPNTADQQRIATREDR